MLNLNRNQKGLALLVTVLMSGVVILGLTMRMGSSQKSQLQDQRGENTAVASQIRAWEASEVIKSYLSAHSDPSTLQVGALNISGLDGVTANIVSNSLVSGNRRLVFEIKASGNGGSSTVLESVYQIGSGGSTPVTGLKNVIQFKGSTVFTAGVTFTGVTNQTINVDGNITFDDGANLNGNSVYATGDISLTGGINVSSMFSEKNINITNCTVNGNPDYIKAIGNIYIDSCGINSNLIQSNGTTYLGATGIHNTIKSNGNLTLIGGTSTFVSTNGTTNIGSGGGNYGTLKSKGSVTQTGNILGSVFTDNSYSISNGSISNISAGNNINLSQWNLNPNSVISGGNINLSNTGQNINTLQAKGNLSNVSNGNINGTIGGSKISVPVATNVNIVAGFDPTPPLVDTAITLLQPASNSNPKIDVNDFIGQANYIFEYESGNIRVTTQNLDGFVDGQKYYLLSGNSPSGQLCPNGDIRSNCIIGEGFKCPDDSLSWGCTSDNTWVTYYACAGGTMGTSWNSCNLGYQNGGTINDVLCPTSTYNSSSCKTIGRQYGYATSNHITYNSGTFNISDENSSKVTLAPGVMFFKGNVDLSNTRVDNTILSTGNITSKSEDIITNASNNVNFANTCQTSYAKPKNLCDVSTRKAPDLGNVALMSGSYNGTVFSGGVIDVRNGKIGGTIIAGDVIKGGGGAVIKGYMVSAKQGTSSKNIFEGGITVDLTGMEASFNASNVPVVIGSTNGGGTAGISIFWSRYK